MRIIYLYNVTSHNLKHVILIFYIYKFDEIQNL